MKKAGRIILRMLLGILMLGMLSSAALADEAVDGLEVHFLNIGRNDGILIRCGGESAFFDAGTYTYGKRAVSYMEGIGLEELTYYVGTHAHRDHVGGAPLIIEKFHPQAVIQPHDVVRQMIIQSAETEAEKQAVSQIEYMNLTVGESFCVGDAVLTCLGPVEIKDVYYGSGAENGNSLVLMLTYGDVSILLTGDATHEEFSEIEKLNPGSLNADVLKNAHHGASVSEWLITAVSPEYIVFSTDESSIPNGTTLSRLRKYGVKMFSTSPKHHGTVILRSNGQTMTFETQSRPESITLKSERIEVYEGDSESLSVSVQPRAYKSLITYETADAQTAVISSGGKVTGVKAGETVVSAVIGNVSARCTVVVKPPEVVFAKAELTVRDGSRVSSNYSIKPYRTKAEITWASMDESIAVVDEKGRVTGIYPGETVITATLSNGQVSELKVTVTPVEVRSVSVKPSSVSMTIGDSRSVSASVSPSDATWKDIVWSSADGSILTVTPEGMLTAVGVGKTKLTATAVNGKSKTISVTVHPVYVKKIVPQSSTVELIYGMEGFESAQLICGIEPENATVKDVTWSSSNKKIASVDENGVITALKNGSTTITCRATDGSGKYTRIKVNVELPTEQIVLKTDEITVYEGTSKTISATIQPYSRTKQLIYTSSDPEIAIVSSSGKVTGVKAGQAVIRVSDQTGVYAECAVTVNASAMKIRKSEIDLKDGYSANVSYLVSPSGAKPAIVWKSMDESIAVVSASGKITGIYPGETIVTAAMPSGQVHSVYVKVTPISVSRVTIKPSGVTMTLGDSRSVTASVSPSSATWQEITWASMDESIVTVTQDGVLTAVGVGKTAIRATTPEGKTHTASVRVNPVYVRKITLSKPNVEPVGGVNGRSQVQISHAVEPANATIQDVTWSSSNKKVAVVDENGVVTGLKAGTVTITCKAADGSGRYARIKVTFLENELNRSVQSVPNEMAVQASRIRYTSGGSVLEVRMTYKNRTGSTQMVPSQGFLVLITPDGEQIILKQIAGDQERLYNGRNDVFTYKISVSMNPKLAGLDLTRCDAVMMTAQEAFAD